MNEYTRSDASTDTKTFPPRLPDRPITRGKLEQIAEAVEGWATVYTPGHSPDDSIPAFHVHAPEKTWITVAYDLYGPQGWVEVELPLDGKEIPDSVDVGEVVEP